MRKLEETLLSFIINHCIWNKDLFFFLVLRRKGFWQRSAFTPYTETTFLKISKKGARVVWTQNIPFWVFIWFLSVIYISLCFPKTRHWFFSFSIGSFSDTLGQGCLWKIYIDRSHSCTQSSSLRYSPWWPWSRIHNQSRTSIFLPPPLLAMIFLMTMKIARKWQMLMMIMQIRYRVSENIRLTFSLKNTGSFVIFTTYYLPAWENEKVTNWADEFLIPVSETTDMLSPLS